MKRFGKFFSDAQTVLAPERTLYNIPLLTYREVKRHIDGQLHVSDIYRHE